MSVPDLIVLSEVLYFFELAEIDDLADWIAAHGEEACAVLSVNWTGPTQETLDGRAAADRLRASLHGFEGPRFDHSDYIVDRLARRGGHQVTTRCGR